MTIEIRGISKRFGSTVALDNVNLTLQDGVIYGLLGNNGAGKTTLLSLITNRIFPNEGEVLIDGESVQNNDVALGKIITMGEQNLYPDSCKACKSIALAAQFYPLFDSDYAMNLADRFGLNLKAKIDALSTGYATILRDIIALAANTPYLLLDEPVLGLDAQHRDMLYKEIIERYAENPRTIVISTHLIAEVASLVEHTVIIDRGRILHDAPTEDLLSGVRNLTGPCAAVEEAARDYRVLSRTVIGGLETICVEAQDRAFDERTLPAGVEVSPVNLQDYFIACMEGRDEAPRACDGKEGDR